VRNSIIAGNTGPAAANGPDVFGSVNPAAPAGYNLIGIDNGSSNWVSTDKVGNAANPKSGGFSSQELANNGGPTMTIALNTSGPNQSLAYLNGDPGLAGTTDQRGVVRQYVRGPGPKVTIGAWDPVGSSS
jgi:hypothetical protein